MICIWIVVYEKMVTHASIFSTIVIWLIVETNAVVAKRGPRSVLTHHDKISVGSHACFIMPK